MSKKLNEAGMESELSGSAFFGGNQASIEPAIQATTAGAENDADDPRMVDTTASPMTPRHHATTVPRVHPEKSRIETIRKAVRRLGKEDTTYRFTSDEKKALADLVYTYHVAGIKTSQNELTRIGVNWLLEDYRENGNLSVLARVVARLND